MKSDLIIAVLSALMWVYGDAVKISQTRKPSHSRMGGSEKLARDLSLPSEAEIWDNDIEKDCVVCKKTKKEKKSSR